MKSYPLYLLLILCIIANSSYIETTNFWKTNLNVTSLTFNTYAGNFDSIKAMNKLIGIIQKELQECIINFLKLMELK
jgi:hypothetical protein